MKYSVKMTELSNSIEVTLGQKEMAVNGTTVYANNTDDQFKLGLSAVINGSDVIQGKRYTKIFA